MSTLSTGLLGSQEETRVPWLDRPSCFGMNRAEALRLPLVLPSGFLMVRGLMAVGQCRVIPTLPAYLMAYGLLRVVIIILSVSARTGRRPGSPAAKAVMVLELLGLVFAAWGAGITWEHITWFKDMPKKACSRTAFIGGFVSSAATLAIALPMILFGVFAHLRKEAPSGAAVASDGATTEGEAPSGV